MAPSPAPRTAVAVRANYAHNLMTSLYGLLTPRSANRLGELENRAILPRTHLTLIGGQDSGRCRAAPTQRIIYSDQRGRREVGWLYLAGNSLIVAGIRQQAGNTGNTAASGQQCSCSYAEFSRTGCPRITDMSSHSGRIMPRHKISTFVGSQRSKLVGFHVTRKDQ